MKNLIENFIHKIAFALAAAFACSVILLGTIGIMYVALSIFQPESIDRFYRGYLHVKSLF